MAGIIKRNGVTYSGGGGSGSGGTVEGAITSPNNTVETIEALTSEQYEQGPKAKRLAIVLDDDDEPIGGEVINDESTNSYQTWSSEKIAEFNGLVKQVTQAQYDAMSEAQKNNGKVYLVSDYNTGGYSPEVYSTTPHLVGKWINGDDIYAVTVDISAALAQTDGNTGEVTKFIEIPGLSFSAVKQIVSYEGFILTSQKYGIMLPRADSNFIKPGFFHGSTDQSIIFLDIYGDHSDYSGYITVKYTINS